MAGVPLGGAFDDVLTAAQAGAGWAMEALWRSLAGTVAGYLRQRGARDADDLTSEVFMGVFRNIGGFGGDEAAFRSWVFTIAHRRMLDDRRRASRRPAEPHAEMDELLDVHGDATARGSDPVEGVEEQVLRTVATERVRRLLAGLAPDQADVLLLRLVAGLTVEEVAVIVGKTPGAVKALQRRGLAAVRRAIETEGVPL